MCCMTYYLKKITLSHQLKVYNIYKSQMKFALPIANRYSGKLTNDKCGQMDYIVHIVHNPKKGNMTLIDK